MAMTNYPYPSNFLEPMPGFPVTETYWSFYNIANFTVADQARINLVLGAILNSTNIYYNYTGQSPCTDYKDTEGTGNLDGFGWNVLACN